MAKFAKLWVGVSCFLNILLFVVFFHVIQTEKKTEKRKESKGIYSKGMTETYL